MGSRRDTYSVLRTNTPPSRMAMKMAMKTKMTMAKKMAMAMKMKMAMRKSIVAKGKRAKASVFSGRKVKTSGGLKKTDLKKNKAGKIVSKKASARAAASKNGKRIAKWGAATKAARKQLNIKGFCPVGGKTAKGQALLKAVRSQMKK